MNTNDIRSDAQGVTKLGSAPRYTRAQYESEMLSTAKRFAQPGEGTASAFARLAGDGEFDELYAAAEIADDHERAEVMKGVEPSDRFMPLLLDLAQMRKRDGETIEAACARLLLEDPVVADAYASTQGL